MFKTIQYLLKIMFITVIIFISAACDMADDSKPWDGKNIYSMNSGAAYSPNSIILNPDLNPANGWKYWYYIDAEPDTTYKIGMTSSFGIHDNWKKHKDCAPNFAKVKMTCYNEAGIKFAELEYTFEPATYYSQKKQRLYVCFEFLTYGYLLFYYDVID